MKHKYIHNKTLSMMLCMYKMCRICICLSFLLIDTSMRRVLQKHELGLNRRLLLLLKEIEINATTKTTSKISMRNKIRLYLVEAVHTPSRLYHYAYKILDYYYDR